MASEELTKMLAGATPETGGIDEPEAPEVSEDLEVGVELPASKSAVHKMKGAELQELYDSPAFDHEIDGWKSLKVSDQKEAVISVLFPSDNAASEDEVGDGDEDAPEDKLAEISKVIENLGDQTEIEARIDHIMESDGLNDFQLGGLFARLMDVGDFSPHKNFSEYVHARFGIKYRKAMYLIEIYTGLLESGVPWAKVKQVGWTKLKTVVDVLTPDNVDEWVAKAAAMNTISLEQAVKDAKAPDEGSGKPSQPASNLKTKTFKFGEDQLEVVNDAIEKAKESSGTDSDSAATEFIMLEYLGNTSGKSPDKALKDKVADLESQLAEAKAKAAAGDDNSEHVTQLEAQLKAATEANASLQEQVTELTGKLGAAQEGAGSGEMPSPATLYAHVASKFDGDLAAAMNCLFGEESGFAEQFPNIGLDISAK